MAKSKTPNAPTRTVWLLALIIGGLGILLRFVDVPALAEIRAYNYWMLLIGFLLLALGTSSKNI